MASSWGRVAWMGALVALAALPRLGALRPQEAVAGETAPETVSVTPADPTASCALFGQGAMVHLFDTGTLAGGPYYVNDHTLVQGPNGAWHLFGIFHTEPMGDDTEVDFIHAVSPESDPAKWQAGTFEAANEPYRIALHAQRSIGETHLWAPHIVAWEGRWLMVYQGGGADDYHASIRLAESDDLYRWTRVGHVPMFEDFCEARDPMLVRREGAWALYYSRCDSITRKRSGVAYRLSQDLVHWSDARMALTMEQEPATSNAAYAESPFVFERGGFFWLSVSAYPLAWDATLVYRSTVPSVFPDAPITRLRAHAAEWVFGARGQAWLTHAGPGQRGVWISPVAM
jgi:hypothetical protein